jgi:biotin transport system permease protein
MAELNILHYLPGKSIIHRMDGRIKLFCMILLSITACTVTRILGLSILTLVLLITLAVSALPVQKLVREMKYFLFLIGLVMLVHAFSVPGTPITDLPIHPTWEGLRSGALFGWRIIFVVLISTVLTATTTLETLKNAIEWFLRPIPWVSETKIATMIGLTFTLVPLIFDQASEMLDAQKSRCLEGRKNPAARIVFLAYPLLFHTLRRADEIVYAMESRCYSGERTPVVFKAELRDWLLLIFSGVMSGVVLRIT